MSDQLIVERGGLEKKDKGELQAIIAAMGGKSTARQTKSDLIDEIINLSSGEPSIEEPQQEDSVEHADETRDSRPAQDASDEDEPEKESVPNPNRQSSRANQEENGNSRRSKKRGRGRQDRQEAGNDPISVDPEPVSGFLDLRDEGYGFLRVNGFLPSKDDVYVSVKQVRQLELRKGDHLEGLSMPAHRNEKNPCFHEINLVNGADAQESVGRESFDELSSLYPEEQLVLSTKANAELYTNRCIDLLAPVGKGQRGLLVGPRGSGKTTFVKDIVASVEANHPDLDVLILSVESRPEEVTDLSNHLQDGEIVASNFDRPADEHIAIAELTLERAKRLAESGEDVFIVVDGLTQLAKAYITANMSNSRSAPAVVDLLALQGVKRFLGGAANLEGAGSVTILSTMTVDSGSNLDNSIYHELKSVANMELRLNGDVAMRGEFPAVDGAQSFTLNDQLMVGSDTSESLVELRSLVREVDSEAGMDGAGSVKLLERLREFDNNADFLSEITKNSSL